MDELTLIVQAREERGKNKNRRLRSTGVVPAVLYGAGKNTVSIQVEKKLVLEFFRGETGGKNAIFLLELEGTGKSRHAMIRDLQIDPLSRKILHIDFQRVLLDQEIHIGVPVSVIGIPEGVKNEGGLLDFVTRELEIQCLPGMIPTSLEVDVSSLNVGDHISAGDLEMPEGVTLKDDPHRVLVAVEARREELEEEEEELDLLETPSAEPEVIGSEEDDKESGA